MNIHHLLAGLNDSQQSAAESLSSVIIINAGPGTGKTKTLISRIAHLILEKKINPSSILGITFTKKAAAEMKERLQKIIPGNDGPYIGTFHSFAFDILSQEREVNIVDEKKRTEIIIEVLKRTEFKLIHTNHAYRTISLYKSRIKKHRETQSELDTVYEKFVIDYTNSLKSQQLMDYDDILLEFYKFLKNPEKLTLLQNRFQHILVDEFQDTNEVQYEIIKLLHRENNLFVIGDPLQSIYSFRGAAADMFFRIAVDFPQAETISLPTNYRSVKNIIHVSSLLFPQSRALLAYRKKEGQASLINTLHEFAEADFIIRTIQSRVGGTDLLQAANTIDHTQTISFADVAVIYRNHRISTVIAEKLFDSGIPYQVIGEDSPYEQKEIRFIIDFLRFIYNKTDQTHIILQNNPFTKGQTDLQSTFENMDISSKPSILIQKIVQYFRLLEQLNNQKEDVRNLMQFQTSMSRFDNDKNGLGNAIEYLHFLEDHEYYDPHCDTVTLLTMHASKGLEFTDVFICGFEDGIIPNIKNSSDMEEEMRLMYVAMTRAKDNLYLLSARSRNKKQSIVSRFKKYIECAYLVEKEDEATEMIKKKMAKVQIKKSQLKIF